MDRSLYADTARAERKELSKAQLDDALDEALEETFPASDAVSVLQPAVSGHHRRSGKKR